MGSLGVMMRDEELLKLYAADQEERRQLELIHDPKQLDRMKQHILTNDIKRRELANELMLELGVKNQSDYRNNFYAAVIFSRGLSQRDQKKAFEYIQKAQKIAQFQNDPLSNHIKDLYQHLALRLKPNLNNKSRSQAEDQYLFALRPKPAQNMKTPVEKEKEALTEKMKKMPRCFVCGKQHAGPCPPK
jgi:hypothetical protein